MPNYKDNYAAYLKGDINREVFFERALGWYNYKSKSDAYNDLNSRWKAAGMEGIAPFTVPNDVRTQALLGFDLGDATLQANNINPERLKRSRVEDLATQLANAGSLKEAKQLQTQLLDAAGTIKQGKAGVDQYVQMAVERSFDPDPAGVGQNLRLPPLDAVVRWIVADPVEKIKLNHEMMRWWQTANKDLSDRAQQFLLSESGVEEGGIQPSLEIAKVIGGAYLDHAGDVSNLFPGLIEEGGEFFDVLYQTGRDLEVALGIEEGELEGVAEPKRYQGVPSIYSPAVIDDPAGAGEEDPIFGRGRAATDIDISGDLDVFQDYDVADDEEFQWGPVADPGSSVPPVGGELVDPGYTSWTPDTTTPDTTTPVATTPDTTTPVATTPTVVDDLADEGPTTGELEREIEFYSFLENMFRTNAGRGLTQPEIFAIQDLMQTSPDFNEISDTVLGWAQAGEVPTQFLRGQEGITVTGDEMEDEEHEWGPVVDPGSSVPPMGGELVEPGYTSWTPEEGDGGGGGGGVGGYGGARFGDISMEELNDFRARARAGQLTPQDVNYLNASMRGTQDHYTQLIRDRAGLMNAKVTELIEGDGGLNDLAEQYKASLNTDGTDTESSLGIKFRYEHIKARLELERQAAEDDMQQLREEGSARFSLVKNEVNDILSLEAPFAPLRTSLQSLYGEGAPEIPVGTFGALASLGPAATKHYLDQYQQRAQPTDYGAARETLQGLFPRANIPTGALEQFGRIPGGISALTSLMGQRQSGGQLGQQFGQPKTTFRTNVPQMRVEA